ncbi:MAG: PAS domain S-box protein, partial [Cyanobacteriota bacterium]
TLLISLVHDITARKQAEMALQESEERFRAIFEQAAVGIVLTTTSGEILRVNQHYCEITGYTQSELLSRPFQEITHPDDLEQNLDYLHQVMTGQLSTYSMEKRYIRKDGNWRWVQVTVSVVHDSANGQNYALGVVKDIHDRKQTQEALREANQTLQALIQASPLAIVALEPDGQVKTWNEAAEEMFGWSATEAIGTLFPVVPIDKQDEFHQLRQRVLQGESLTGVEALRQSRDGTAIYISISAAPLYDATGQIDGIMAVIADISDKKAAEESIRDSEAKFRAFLEAASEAVIVTNAKGEIVVFNAKAEELFGYDRTEAFGRTVEFLMPERYHQIHTEHRSHYKTHPTKRSMGKTSNLLARRKDGTEFPIEAGLSPVQTKDGRFVMTFLTDITKRKQAEEEITRLNESLERRAIEVETRYQQIVELAEEGIWVIDNEGKTTYVNQAMARMLGYQEEEMLGRPLFDFMDEAAQQTANANLERRKQGIGEKHEFKLQTKDGKGLWTYMSTSPVLDESGKLLWSCALVYDITERKKADEQLRESSERISLANAELARATRLKDEFLASMSHELRTPLNAILGLAEALQEEVYGSLTDRQRRSLVTIEQSGQHLLDLITDILDLSKIESGTMELQITSSSPHNLCESSFTFVKQQAHHKSIKLSSKISEGLGNIEVDERRMRQVLVNLLSNAVKFTPEGGEVRMEVETDSEAEIIKLSVIDTGIGIAPENLDKLFKPFVQLDSSLSRRYAGTGLGLALVRRIVELHGGSVSLESEVGKGSQFTVNLPWKEPDRGQSVRKTEQELLELPSIHNALIVEDSETAAKQVARYLAELGSAAFIHPQGEGAVEAAQKFDPEVIILDLLLPHISGWEVLTQLKANPATQHIPVLVISVVDERSRALEQGASEYLVKPISRKQLQSALCKIFAETSQSSTHAALVVMPEEERHLPLVLLAEDNEANISTVVDFLQIHGFRVTLARNGVEAVQMAHQQKPDLILMDIQMPEMDGIEATHRIHSDSELTNIPIIALTALAMPGDRERCLAAGALEYLTKPVSLKKLVNVIAQYINTSDFS